MALSKIQSPMGTVLPAGLAIGGTVTEYESGGTVYRVHSFTNTGTNILTIAADTQVDFLLVGGGGASTAAEGTYGSIGGAGAGGMVVGTSQTVSAGNHTIVVGAGGVRSTDVFTVGGNGGDTTFNGFTAKGGGGSGDYDTDGPAGGSGAGGSENIRAPGSSNQDTYSGTTGVTGYGNAGGSAGSYPSGGSGSGGGAGGAGGPASGGTVAGGDGLANSFRTGSPVTYATGGQGVASNTNGVAGGANTGDGAGGVSTTSGNNTNSADGGSGIVVVRYALN